MTTISKYSTPAARGCARRALRGIALATACLLIGAIAADAQQPNEGRLWAAQTGINQITLVWDSVPGTAEYRVYLGDPSAPGTLSKRPLTVLSASGRSAIITGMQRAANGITLVAVDAGGRVLRQTEFNRVTPATFFPPATSPTAVTAQATSGSEVVLTWDPVPGATGYVIARAVHRSGFSMLCSLCPSEARYVDHDIMAGLPHTYTVAAIFPSGDVSKRATSTPVTPGATQIVTAPVATPSGAPTGATSGPPGVPAGAMSPTPSGYTPPGVPAGAMPPTTSGYTPPGQPAGTMPTTNTSGYTPPGAPAGAMPPTTSGYPAPGVPTTSGSATTLSGRLGNLVTLGTLLDSLASAPTSGGTTTLSSRLGSLLTIRTLLDSLTSSTHTASAVSSGTVSSGTVSTNPMPATPLETALGNMRNLIDSLLSGASLGDTTHSATPVATPIATPNPTDTLGSVANRIVGALSGMLSGGVAAPPSVTAAATGPATVMVNWQPSPTTGLIGYTVTRSLNGGASEELAKVSPTELSYTDRFFPATLFASGTVQVKYGVVATAPAGFRGTVSNEVAVQPLAPAPSPVAGSVAACRLDFQRADNMWAGFGIPTGSLGTESIALSPGQNKVFITDWKYEKQPNDGTNFYGSHLRIGANPMSSTIRLHLRSWTLTGLQVFARTGSDTFWIRLDPNTTKQFQADLMEVFCES